MSSKTQSYTHRQDIKTPHLKQTISLTSKYIRDEKALMLISKYLRDEKKYNDKLFRDFSRHMTKILIKELINVFKHYSF